MAKPRVFISSTYFDLRVVRADLDRFIKDIGYEPILFEKGQIPYSKDEALEEGCYKEIGNCDIIITIIGGKYGSQSNDKEKSITHKELKQAIEHGKQIYVFVQSDVYNEYRTYQNNKDVKGFKPVTVDDVKVFGFLEEVYSLPIGNPVTPFELPENIAQFLKEQWAGLFQRLLYVASKENEINLIKNLDAATSQLKELVSVLIDNSNKSADSIDAILLARHPAFAAIKNLLKVPYRVYFETKAEMENWLTARGFKQDLNPDDANVYEWDNHKDRYGIQINNALFNDDGKLRIFSPRDWDDKWISKYNLTSPAPKEEDEEEIPF